MGAYKPRKKTISMGNTNKEPVVEIVRETVTKFRHSIFKTPEDLTQLAEQMVDYVKKTDTCYSITNFLVAAEILSDMFYDWVEKSPDLQNALKYSKQIIADRREKGALAGTLPLAAVMPYMAMFSKEYKQYAEWRASLVKDKEPEARQVVVIERFTPTVPCEAGSEARVSNGSSE